MPDSDDAAITVRLWELWAATGEQLTAEQWATPTRLGEWTVHDVFGHVAPVPAELAAFLEQTSEQPPAAQTGGDILRMFNQPGGLAHLAAPQVAAGAKAVAAGTPGPELAARFRGLLEPDFLTGIRGIPQDRVIAHPVLGAVTTRAVVEVSLVEHTVHLLDIRAALAGVGVTIDVPDEAVHRALTIVLGAADEVELLESATGRRPSVLPLMR